MNDIYEVYKMTKNRWDKFKKNFSKDFIDFLMIFAAEQDFINKHRRKSSIIKEQDRYGSDQRKKSEK
ncbi:hypothetical protein DB324_02915 [Limosilactobacillus reuteri]|uniref:hypothetical protein n=1 Tax=Limosilactobacillus reuteri TaxID=1598 RepID=UPI000C1B72F9|nr:hypothetical protein [Limosilactobacillus reuteri]MQB67409.1 hypothetical protein [Limosilactobacillus reuteri]MQB94724.1 hypothetical protein [Limosilactobacillus reuteri]PIN30788.1 hypothetical protein CUC10_03070 [Limosilactobacillus reuteri]PUH35407.1 hypothetical protein DB324_02915 [Limosilactobacillus reuteri]PUH35478.1 hypothetical protein DB323_02910 [Limosilactobacillus reuteri]